MMEGQTTISFKTSNTSTTCNLVAPHLSIPKKLLNDKHDHECYNTSEDKKSKEILFPIFSLL